MAVNLNPAAEEGLIVIIKDFQGFSADQSLLKVLREKFKLRPKPTGENEALRYAVKKITSRQYGKFDPAVIKRGGQLHLYLEGVLVAVVEGGEVVKRFLPEDKDLRRESFFMLRDFKRFFEEAKNGVLPEKASSIVRSFLTKRGSIPLRPDMYITKDGVKLREFLRLFEESSRADKDHFILFSPLPETLEVAGRKAFEREKALREQITRRIAERGKVDSGVVKQVWEYRGLLSGVNYLIGALTLVKAGEEELAPLLRLRDDMKRFLSTLSTQKEGSEIKSN